MSASDDLAKGLVELMDAIAPIIEVAEGQRKLLESRGWSPTAAEAFALELLLGLTRQAMGGAKK